MTVDTLYYVCYLYLMPRNVSQKSRNLNLIIKKPRHIIFRPADNSLRLYVLLLSCFVKYRISELAKKSIWVVWT